MKSSGVEWIGEIPVDWDTIKIKQLPDRSIENSFVDGDWIESPDISDEGIRYLTTGNIGDGKYKKQGNGFVTLEVFQNLNCKYAYPGDLVISRLNAPYGRSCILPDDYSEYVLAVDNVILRTNNDKKYICYITQCDGYQKSVEDNAKGTTMKRISRTNLGNVLLPFPPLSEQHRIADFLDEKCAKIDAVIEKQKQVIEKLREYKLSVITEAVTKGLDPTVPMKDSGVEWIGEIPEDWSTQRMKSCLHESMQYGALETGIEYSTDLPRYIRITDITADGNLKVDNRLSLPYNNAKNYMLEDGDVLFARSGGTVGKTFIYKKEYGLCAFAGYLIKAKCNSDKLLPKFLYYYTLSNSYDLWKNYIFIQATIQNIGADKYSNMPIVVPTIIEQTEIIHYLDKQCYKIDLAMAKKQSIIEKLTEYKKSLIYEVVTGKKEV